MKGNQADIKVSGPAAHTIVRSFLGSLGIDAEEIDQFTVDFTLDGEQTTTVTLDADGPLAGLVVSGMVGSVDWDEHTAIEVEAHAESTDDVPAAEPESEEDTGTESASSSSSSGAYKPQVTPVMGKVDPEYIQFPGEEPGRIRENTNLHVVAVLLLRWYQSSGDDWVNGETLAEADSCPLGERQIQSGLSRMFLAKGLVVRRQQPNAGKRKYQYHPTKQLQEEVDRLGEFDPEKVRENAERHS